MVVGPRAGHERGDVLGLEGLHDGGRQLEAEVDEVHRPAHAGRGAHEVGDLVGAEGDGDVRDHVRPVELTGVHVDSRGHVDRHHRDAGQRVQRRDRLGPQPGPSPDAHDAVDHDVGAGRVGDVVHDAAARPP